MERLVQLIPAEVVALYLTFHAGTDPNGLFAFWWPIICLALVIVVRVRGTLDPGGSIWSVQPIAVIVAAISFVLWIYGIGDTIWNFTVSESRWISAAIAVWTIAIPGIPAKVIAAQPG